MTDYLNLGNLLRDESKSLADLDWLAVDMEDYQAVDILPRQNLDIIPELEQQWRYLSDQDKIRLSPNNREPARPNTPFWSEREVANDLSDAQKLAIVEAFFRRDLQSGLPAKAAAERLSRAFDADLLRKSAGKIKEALEEEEGLLGVVYVDASLFPGWNKQRTAEIQQMLTPAGRQAPFVVLDAFHHVDDFGRCSKFQKNIVFHKSDIQYDENLWEHYKGYYTAMGKELGGISPDLSPRDKIRQAYFAPYRQDKVDTGVKPVVKMGSSLTKERALAEFEAYARAWTRDIVGNNYRKDKINRIAIAMMQAGGNPHGPHIVDMVNNDPDLASLKPHLHLLGNLYADLSYFKTAEDATQSLSGMEFPIIVGKPYGSSQKTSAASSPATIPAFHINMPESVNHIVHRYALGKYGHGYGSKRAAKKVLSRLAGKLTRCEAEKLRRFAQGVYSQPLPAEVRKYTHLAPVIVDPTKGMGMGAALSAFGKYQPDRVKVLNTYRGDLEKNIATQMLLGDQSESLLARVLAEGFDDLSKHFYLAGNLYVLSDYHNSDEIARLVEERRELADLPVLSGEDACAFFETKTAKAKIIKRIASLGLTDKKILRGYASELKISDAPNTQKIAQMVFSRPLGTKIAAYQAVGQFYDPTGGMSLQESLDKFNSYQAEKVKVLNTYRGDLEKKLATQMMLGDHSEAMLARIHAEGLQDLRDHHGLLGNMYVMAKYITASEIKKLAKKKPDLANLPVFQGSEELEDYLRSKAARTTVMKHYAKACHLGPDQRGKIAATLKSVAKMDVGEFRKFAQLVFAKAHAGAQQARAYSAYGQRVGYGKGMGIEAAWSALRQATVSTETPGMPQADKAVILRVARRMLAGDHGPAVETMLGADPLLAPLQPHLHLLGKLYTASYLFEGPRSYGIFQNLNPHLKDLPDIGGNPAEFFQRPEIKEKIAKRAALVENISVGSRPDFLERFKTKLSGKSADQIMEIARGVYASTTVKATQKYQGHKQTAYMVGGAKTATSGVERQVRRMLSATRELLAKNTPADEIFAELKAAYPPAVFKAGSHYVDQIIEAVQHNPLDFVEEETLYAPTGLDQMESMELTHGHVHNLLENIDISGVPQEATPLEGFSFGGLTLSED